MNLENLLKAQQLFACTEISLGSKNQLLGCCKQSWEDAQSWLEYLPWISSCSPWNKQHSGMQTASCFRRDSADSQNVSKAKLDRTELWIFLWNSGVLQLICLIIRRKNHNPNPTKKTTTQHSSKSPGNKRTVSLFIAFWDKALEEKCPVPIMS